MTEIKRENLNYGVNVEPLLDELSQCEVGDISNGEFEVEGENEGACSGFCTIEIPKLAGDALNVIAALQEQVRALASENSALARYFSASSVAVNHWNSWADTEDKLACAPETPATDAALREIRAQAVEGFADYIAFYYSGAKQIARYYAASIRAGEQP